IDQTAAFSVGFTNTLGTPLTINSLSFMGDDVSDFMLGEELDGTLEVPVGGAFGVGVFATRQEDKDAYNATLVIGFANSETIEINLDVATQATPIITVNSLETRVGTVDYGTHITESFTIGNAGKGDLNFDL